MHALSVLDLKFPLITQKCSVTLMVSKKKAKIKVTEKKSSFKERISFERKALIRLEAKKCALNLKT